MCIRDSQKNGSLIKLSLDFMSWLLIITKLTYDYSLRRNEGIVGGLKPEDLGQKDFLDTEKK